MASKAAVVYHSAGYLVQLGTHTALSLEDIQGLQLAELTLSLCKEVVKLTVATFSLVTQRGKTSQLNLTCCVCKIQEVGKVEGGWRGRGERTSSCV